jgi:hypothetical protein
MNKVEDGTMKAYLLSLFREYTGRHEPEVDKNQTGVGEGNAALRTASIV